MSIRFVRSSLFAAALLGGALGLDAVEPVDCGVAESQVLTSQAIALSASLPSYRLSASLFAISERDIRGGRVASQLYPSSRERPRSTRGSAADSANPPTRDDVARLLRAGLQSSSLGTPPPQS